MKKVIIFDFDDTIVMSLKRWTEIIEHETAVKFGVSSNPGFHSMRPGKTNIQSAEIFLELHGVNSCTPEELLESWHGQMEREYGSTIDFVPGAFEAIEYLKGKGYTVVIATATAKSLIDIALKKYHLDTLVDHVVSEEMIGKSKKYPEVFNYIFELTHTTPEECFYFEDSYVAIQTAHDLGIDICAILTDLNKSHLDTFQQCAKAITKEYTIPLLQELGL